jgi:hypothetical protein
MLSITYTPHSIAFAAIRYQNTSMLYGGVRSSSQVCAGICKGVSIESWNVTCHIDIRSIDDS